MKHLTIKLTFYFIAILSVTNIHGENSTSISLKRIYEKHCKRKSTTNEHLPTLKQLATECSSVMEIGIQNIVSTWALLFGLSENHSATRTYIGIDINMPPIKALNLAKYLAQEHAIDFHFWQNNDMEVNNELPVIELLFIDSLHTYCHLTYELEKFSPNVSKYIAMHDTSAPYEFKEDENYEGDYSEYPLHFDRNKKGLWPAVQDFLVRHPEWQLHKRYLNNHGLTILKRIL